MLVIGGGVLFVVLWFSAGFSAVRKEPSYTSSDLRDPLTWLLMAGGPFTMMACSDKPIYKPPS